MLSKSGLKILPFRIGFILEGKIRVKIFQTNSKSGLKIFFCIFAL